METQHDFVRQVQQLGVPTTPNVVRCKGIEETQQQLENLIEKLPLLDFEVDGIVIKVDRIDLRSHMGTTSKSPRWVIAYKWEKYEAITQVEKIDIQVGKTGALTPVAYLAPVEIAGTTVSRASLHNRDEIERLEICEHDVVVEKAGKIIPHVVRVEKHRRTGAEIPFDFPDHCPECGGEVRQDEGAFMSAVSTSTVLPNFVRHYGSTHRAVRWILKGWASNSSNNSLRPNSSPA
ncbi:MAG: hypothetical protein R3C11_03115 [Planctomycetaceae bacterium]